VSSKNGTDNNGTNGKVGKNATFSILGFGVGVWNEGFRFGDLSLGFKGWEFGVWSF